MADYRATVSWARDGAAFTDNRYSRGHRWEFGGDVVVPASASPHVVPLPLSLEAAVDPEEALVASLSSCHMLWFLSIAAKAGWTVERYRDEAVGVLARDPAGKQWMAVVTLRPEVHFIGDRAPTAAEVTALHDAAHDECYIARSVRTDVRCEPVGLANP